MSTFTISNQLKPDCSLIYYFVPNCTYLCLVPIFAIMCLLCWFVSTCVSLCILCLNVSPCNYILPCFIRCTICIRVPPTSDYFYLKPLCLLNSIYFNQPTSTYFCILLSSNWFYRGSGSFSGIGHYIVNQKLFLHVWKIILQKS